MSEWCLQADTNFNECIEMSVKFNQIIDKKKIVSGITLNTYTNISHILPINYLNNYHWSLYDYRF